MTDDTKPKSLGLCDLCSEPAYKGLKLGTGYVILCPTHHEAARTAIRQGLRNSLRAIGSLVRERYPRLVQAAEMLVRIAN